MKLAIMQPYFLPYIGYWQLLAAVDVFVVYDNIKYTKKGWINRNRFLQNGRDELFSIPLKAGSDSLDICEREIAPDFRREKLLNQLINAYRKAPHFAETLPLMEACVHCPDMNLFRYILNSINLVAGHLGITTRIVPSSTLGLDHKPFKAQDKVLAICGHLRATQYLNAVGGTGLYEQEAFRAAGIELHFLKSDDIHYAQFGGEFVPWLSIVDVLMFNEMESVRGMLSRCALI
jgi:hypothetical protein